MLSDLKDDVSVGEHVTSLFVNADVVEDTQHDNSMITICYYMTKDRHYIIITMTVFPPHLHLINS